MGRLGYLSEAQDSLAVSYNDLESYAASLDDALTKSYPPYETIGIRDGDDYRQLAPSLLQIENEFYSTIRPKRVVRPGERPLHALRERGVQYVEIRAMDLDPFSAVGIAAETARFLDIFLLHCLLSDSPPDSLEEIKAIGRNKQSVAARGREPGLRLDRGRKKIELREWAGQILAECAPIARMLDTAQRGSAYHEALSAATGLVSDPTLLPSARILNEMQQQYDGSYFRFALAYSLRHRVDLQRERLPADLEALFARLADESLDKQRVIEEGDKISFEQYRQQYLSPESLRAG
jgi:glutamate--cysteine ligase